nr:hypothetical protein 21 [Candidatus Omnitrophota bacterium]
MSKTNVVYFERFCPSAFHVHSFSSARCFFVEELGCVFGQEAQGTFSSPILFSTTRKEFIDETKEAVGKFLGDEGGTLVLKTPEDSLRKEMPIEFKNMKTLELELETIKRITENLDQMKNSEKIAVEEVDKLLQLVGPEK